MIGSWEEMIGEVIIGIIYCQLTMQGYLRIAVDNAEKPRLALKEQSALAHTLLCLLNCALSVSLPFLICTDTRAAQAFQLKTRSCEEGHEPHSKPGAGHSASAQTSEHAIVLTTTRTGSSGLSRAVRIVT